MLETSRALWSLCLVLGCATATNHEDGIHDSEPPKLVTQRVTATVKREATWLVHVRTEHEALLTTPEHPFATPHSGWTPAGRLVPGDRIVSARFGTVRVLSVQKEKAAQPQLVFNLSVDRSHTYVVGTEQVLVHNKKCKNAEERAKELDEAQRELEALNQRLLIAEDKAALSQQVAEAKSRVAKIKLQINKAQAYQKKKTPPGTEPDRPAPEVARDPEAPRNDALGRNTRAVEAVESEIRRIERTTRGLAQPAAGIQQHLAQLKSERARLRLLIRTQRAYEKRKLGIAATPQHQRLLQRAEVAYESATNALETAQREFSEHMAQNPQSDAEKKAHAKRKAALERKLKSLRMDHEAANQVLIWERRVVELVGHSPRTDAERQTIEQEQRDLRVLITKSRKLKTDRTTRRRQLANPEMWKKELKKTRRELERDVAEPTTIDEQRLAELERELNESLRGGADPVTADVVEDMWRYQETVLAEAEDVDAELLAIAESFRTSPSPEREAAAASSLRALQQELGDERRAVEMAEHALAREQEELSHALPGPGSSRNAERLAEVYQERAALRVQWQRRMQHRLGDARQRLQIMQSLEGPRDETAEAALGRQIALLEREMQTPLF